MQYLEYLYIFPWKVNSYIIFHPKNLKDWLQVPIFKEEFFCILLIPGLDVNWHTISEADKLQEYNQIYISLLEVIDMQD